MSELAKECKNMDDVQSMLRDLFKDTIQEILEAEMESLQGYDKHGPAGNNSGNSRNGYNKKTVKTKMGKTELQVPRDRNGEFDPQIIKKYETTSNELEDQIIAMYAKGMSTRDIEDHMRDIYGIEVSATMVSKVTDKIMPLVAEWQARPLDKVYPIVFLDAIHFKVRKENRIVNKAAYSVWAVNIAGKKEVLADLKTVYQSLTLEEAEYAFEEFKEKWGKRHPIIIRSWENNWLELTTYFEYPYELRKMIYTTNIIEGYHRQLRKVTKTKTAYPTDDALRKIIYLATIGIAKKWRNCVSHLAIYFGDRIEPALLA